MMIKSFVSFLFSYLIFLPVIVGSVPLRPQKAARALIVGKRYFLQQTGKRFLHTNFYRSGFPAKYLTRLPFFDSSKGKIFRSYWELVGAQKRSRRDQKRTHGHNRRFYLPFLYACSTLFALKQKKPEAHDSTLEDKVNSFCDRWDYQYEDTDTWEKCKSYYEDISRLWEHVKVSENKTLILKMLPTMSSLGEYCLDVKYALEEAEKLLKEVLKYVVEPDATEDLVKSLSSNIYWNLGRVQMEQSYISTAIEYFEKALTYNVEKIKASIYCSLAKAYLEQEKLDLCIDSIEKADKFRDQSKFIRAATSQVRAKYNLKKLEFDSAEQCIEMGLEYLGDEDHPCKLPLYHTMFDILWETGYANDCRDLILKMEKVTFRYFPYLHKWSFYCYYKKGLQPSCWKVNDTWYLEDSSEHFKKAFEVGEEIWRPDHLNNIQCGLNLATALFEPSTLWSCEHEKCIKLAEKALQFAIENGDDNMKTIANFKLQEFKLKPDLGGKLNSV